MYVFLLFFNPFLFSSHYNMFQENMGRREVDAAGCKTVYISEYVPIAIQSCTLALRAVLSVIEFKLLKMHFW